MYSMYNEIIMKWNISHTHSELHIMTLFINDIPNNTAMCCRPVRLMMLMNILYSSMFFNIIVLRSLLLLFDNGDFFKFLLWRSLMQFASTSWSMRSSVTFNDASISTWFFRCRFTILRIPSSAASVNIEK